MKVLSRASERAYASDVRDLEKWMSELGLAGSALEVDETRLFAYLAFLARQGRTPSTIRRRMTAIRSYLDAHGARAIGREALLALERRARASAQSQTAVLVVSDDRIVRVGLQALLDDAGILCWSSRVAEIDAATVASWDYVLVWLDSPDGIDPYGSIRHLRALGVARTVQVPIIAITTGSAPPMVQLRLAEAGVRYLVPHSWVAAHTDDLPARLSDAELPREFHLETPLALRQRLGLRLSGRIDALLDEALGLPIQVWLSALPLVRLPVTRAQVQRLRRIALEEAGIPAPDFSRYATSVRRAPDFPEWSVVRDVVRQGFATRVT